MRRRTLVLFLCLAVLSSPGLFLAAPTRGETTSDFQSPKDTVHRYFDSILGPALAGKSPPGGIVRAFYDSGLADVRASRSVKANL